MERVREEKSSIINDEKEEQEIQTKKAEMKRRTGKKIEWEGERELLTHCVD